MRLGTSAIELLRKEQARAAKLEVKGMWEVPIATITGRENKELVGDLLAGSNGQRELACEIIVAARSKDWLPELSDLQLRKGFERTVASDAIATCFRAEGIPALKKGLAADRENFAAKYALEELRLRAKRGEPTEMWRYEFR